MSKLNSIQEILDFAIEQEQEAVDFYNSLAETTKNKDMQKIFKSFALEEIGHKARLTKIMKEGLHDWENESVADLKIADYLTDTEPSPNMDYKDALILAMKREKNAYKLYNNLAYRAPNNDLKEIFLSLASEESKHKLRFELEYDDYVLREN
ncbi:MAG: ferritin family protein [Bacteroidota bacterium]|nr:ferritin family protein [Bacteroidota bacterium]